MGGRKQARGARACGGLLAALKEAVGEGLELGDTEEEASGEVDAADHCTGEGEGAKAGEETPVQEVGEEEAANLPTDDTQHGPCPKYAQQAGDEVASGHGAEQVAQVEEVEEEVESGDE